MEEETSIIESSIENAFIHLYNLSIMLSGILVMNTNHKLIDHTKETMFLHIVYVQSKHVKPLRRFSARRVYMRFGHFSTRRAYVRH